MGIVLRFWCDFVCKVGIVYSVFLNRKIILHFYYEQLNILLIVRYLSHIAILPSKSMIRYPKSKPKHFSTIKWHKKAWSGSPDRQPNRKKYPIIVIIEPKKPLFYAVFWVWPGALYILKSFTSCQNASRCSIPASQNFFTPHTLISPSNLNFSKPTHNFKKSAFWLRITHR